MSLRAIQLAYEYRSDTSNLIDDFYVPCLSESTSYCRAVGYFTSQGLAFAAKGLTAFINSGGRMRLVASPWLEPEDIQSFERGYEARNNVLERAILRQLTEEVLERVSPLVRLRLECLAWLIADNKLDIKLAFRQVENQQKEIGSIYHEKVGIFADSEGNSVAFTGSPNETVGGLVSNFESMDVYVSWDDPHGRVRRKQENFERLWSNTTKGLIIFDFPDAARQRLLRIRPVRPPDVDPEASTPGRALIEGVSKRPFIKIPDDVQLRSYQLAALNAWMHNRGRGVLAMATGTGKTITALTSGVRLLQDLGKLFIVVACPFQHLVIQWAEEAERFGFRPILAYSSYHTWEKSLGSRVFDYNLGTRENVFVITTHATFVGENMQSNLASVRGPSLLIADEVHHLGAKEARERLPQIFEYRMGLSATPNRWFDKEGTLSLETYFGQTVFEFPLREAIREGCLVEYVYYPILVELTSDELDEYEKLSVKIAQMFDRGSVPGEDPALDSLLRKRSNILNKASNKITLLSDLIHKQGDIHHTLFYCVPGQIDEVTQLLGKSLNIRVHKFTNKESAEQRHDLLDDFEKGELQALTAMRCLDEGVDVPSTQVAYLLASSSNPREFIQRRGRILRKSPGKESAILYDMIAVPPSIYVSRVRDSTEFKIERQIVRKELERFREFAESARNYFEATASIWNLAKVYGLLDF
jgi:DNA phosphorothioation system restriction enzyme